jgi:hypothetical protein
MSKLFQLGQKFTKSNIVICQIFAQLFVKNQIKGKGVCWHWANLAFEVWQGKNKKIKNLSVKFNF